MHCHSVDVPKQKPSRMVEKARNIPSSSAGFDAIIAVLCCETVTDLQTQIFL